MSFACLPEEPRKIRGFIGRSPGVLHLSTYSTSKTFQREPWMNEALRGLEPLVGEWDVTMTNAWFLESMDTEIHGIATIEWYAEAFLLLRLTFPGRTRDQGGSAS